MTCSTCKENETIGSGTRCRPCQAAYMRTYRKTVRTQDIRRAKAEGRETFRVEIIRLIKQFSGELTRENVSTLIGRVE